MADRDPYQVVGWVSVPEEMVAEVAWIQRVCAADREFWAGVASRAHSEDSDNMTIVHAPET